MYAGIIESGNRRRIYAHAEAGEWRLCSDRQSDLAMLQLGRGGFVLLKQYQAMTHCPLLFISTLFHQRQYWFSVSFTLLRWDHMKTEQCLTLCLMCH